MEQFQPTQLPQPQPRPPRHRVALIVGIIIILIIAAFVVWRLRQETTPGEPNQPTAEEQAAAQAFEESKVQQRLANLEGIHLLIEKYKKEHGNYPAQLADLADIKGYAPGVAKMISETKLDNGQPAYTYTLSNGSYQLCANRTDGEPKCEGPKQ
jgi:hypothetical protein